MVADDEGCSAVSIFFKIGFVTYVGSVGRYNSVSDGGIIDEGFDYSNPSFFRLFVQLLGVYMSCEHDE